MRKEKNENNILDFKSTMEALIEEEKPEVSQEEAIRAYNGEKNDLKKKNKKSSDSESGDPNDIEDEEHLKRLKKELLESLERVNVLAKKIFEEKGEKDSIKNIKVRKGAAGGRSSQQKDMEKDFEKNREDIINQMREKVQDSKMQDEQERSREE